MNSIKLPSNIFVQLLNQSVHVDSRAEGNEIKEEEKPRKESFKEGNNSE
jgi:hypothetical protein